MDTVSQIAQARTTIIGSVSSGWDVNTAWLCRVSLHDVIRRHESSTLLRIGTTRSAFFFVRSETSQARFSAFPVASLRMVSHFEHFTPQLVAATARVRTVIIARNSCLQPTNTGDFRYAMAQCFAERVRTLMMHQRDRPVTTPNAAPALWNPFSTTLSRRRISFRIAASKKAKWFRYRNRHHSVCVTDTIAPMNGTTPGSPQQGSDTFITNGPEEE